MQEELPEYKLYAIRYATRDGRRPDHFLDGDPHNVAMPMDYFVWVAVGNDKTFVIDTGFTKEVAEKRKRTFLFCPIQALSKLGIEAADVSDVIITHLHYDHAGNFDRLPNACFHIQEKEIQFATGRHMRFPNMSRPFEIEDVCKIIHLNYNQRVKMYTGFTELSPGIRLHPTGGHTEGLQFVSVHTARGWVAIASDVSHFYANVDENRPFRLAVHVGNMMEGFEKLRSASSSPEHIIPGHDPQVMNRYPAASKDLAGTVVALHIPPKTT